MVRGNGGNHAAYPQVYADLGVLDWAYPPDAFYEYLQRLIRRGLGNNNAARFLRLGDKPLEK